jgi:ABC-2 type transport system permease protein
VIGAAIKKDVWLLLADRGRLAMLFVMPLAFIVVFGSMFKFGPDKGTKQDVAVFYADGSAIGERIEKRLAESSGFAPKKLASADAVRAAVASEGFRVGVVVPRDVADTDDHRIEIVLDQGAPIQARAPLEGAIIGTVMQAMSPLAGKQPQLVETRTPPGIKKPLDGISAFQVVVPGNAVLFGFFMVMTIAMSIAHERHSGAWRRLLAAPVPRWKLLVGKLVPYYLAGLVQLATIFGVGAFVFGMQVAGSMVALAVVTALVAACAIALGLLVASFGWTERQIGSGVPVIILVMGLLGGCMFPRVAMPPFMQDLGHVVPHSWALDAYYDVLVRQGTSIADIAPQLGALAAFAGGFALLGLWRFRFE